MRAVPGKLDEAKRIVTQQGVTLPAMGAICKQCHWHSHCKAHIRKLDDLTLIAELGRSKRDAMLPHIRTVHDLARIDLTKAPTFKGIGKGTLEKFQIRACLLTDPSALPYCTTTLSLPKVDRELFFDIEVDPMRDICYLHGFIERHNGDNKTERFIPFVAESPTPDEEERAFAEAWQYVRSRQPCAICFYSKYARTWWRKLQQRYPQWRPERT